MGTTPRAVAHAPDCPVRALLRPRFGASRIPFKSLDADVVGYTVGVRNEWVGTGYSGASNLRFPDGNIRRAFVMLQRYPRIPQSGDLADGDYSTDDGYEDWWGYVRYEPGDDEAPVDAPDYDEPLTLEADERIPMQPDQGWPGKPLRVEVIHSHGRGSGFEALVREYDAPDGE